MISPARIRGIPIPADSRKTEVPVGSSIANVRIVGEHSEAAVAVMSKALMSVLPECKVDSRVLIVRAMPTGTADNARGNVEMRVKRIKTNIIVDNNYIKNTHLNPLRY